MSFKTATRHFVTIYVDKQGAVAGSVIRDKKPKRGLVIARYWAVASDPAALMHVLETTINEWGSPD